MAILKVIEIMANSDKSWEDAVQRAITKVGGTISNIRSAYVKDMTTSIENNRIIEYRCTLKVSFEVE